MILTVVQTARPLLCHRTCLYVAFSICDDLDPHVFSQFGCPPIEYMYLSAALPGDLVYLVIMYSVIVDSC